MLDLCEIKAVNIVVLDSKNRRRWLYTHAFIGEVKQSSVQLKTNHNQLFPSSLMLGPLFSDLLRTSVRHYFIQRSS